MVRIIIKDIVDEIYQDYKYASMLIAMPTCTWKCLREKNLPLDICQNSKICKLNDIEVSNFEIIERFKNNINTKAIIFAGLEPMDSFDDVLSFVDEIRSRDDINSNDSHIVIYTGYNEDEVEEKIFQLEKYRNIFVKFGRYVPDSKPKFDKVLGVELASENQYAIKLKQRCIICDIKKDNVKSLNGKNYCKKHYNHMYRYGKIVDRTIYDGNEFSFDDDLCYIQLYDKKCNPTTKCIIDKRNYEKIKDFKWYERKPTKGRTTYCVTKSIKSSNSIAIQDVILDNLDENFSPIKKYDHINNEGLDNRECNLRAVTHQQNAMNIKAKANNNTGVNGVAIYLRDSVPKWNSTIMYNYKGIHLYRGTSFDDAVLARLRGEIEYFCEHSNNYNVETENFELIYVSKDDNKNTHIILSKSGEIIMFEKED